jgi:hypothetical protein
VALSLPAGPCLLRPTFGALVAAEAELGSLFAVLERAAAGQARMAEMAALFWHCRADPEEMERGRFEAALLDAGLATLLPPFRALLSGVFGGRG